MPKKKSAAGLTLGQKVKQGRERMKMTLDELSRKTGYDVDVLQNVEAESIMPPVSLILQLTGFQSSFINFWVELKSSTLYNR
jgi:transcriptional regulator with XRE-family HTH domain